jgi:hypothetical protein
MNTTWVLTVTNDSVAEADVVDDPHATHNAPAVSRASVERVRVK